MAELKGKSATIPNENILINTLALQEAKDSSAIENIITTHDELYDYPTILNLMNNLEKFINDNSLSDAYPLIKMALLHFQFETIHPFYDGNGRTGRILNILYLVQQDLLDLPILYLSRFIIQRKADYYR